MQTDISIKMAEVRPSNEIVIIVRKVVSEDNRMISKYGLSRTGEWLVVPEGAVYPEECYFPLPQNVQEPPVLTSYMTAQEFWAQQV